MQQFNNSPSVTALCEHFGVCGGCAYQDLSYEEELSIKLNKLKEVLNQKNTFEDHLFRAVTPSPEPYYYRHRLDLTLRKSRGEWKLGYVHRERHYVIEINQCPIARAEINAYLPGLKAEALAKLTEKYKNANLVVRTDDSGKVRWGGIGRKSLEMQPDDYFSTTVKGMKVHYALDTFFQANLFILDALMDKILELESWGPGTVFFDLYSGVGLFGLVFAKHAGEVILIEENPASDKLARYNASYHNLENVRVLDGTVEKNLPVLVEPFGDKRKIAMIDPPRKGLSAPVVECLKQTAALDTLFYLSCSPESLARDLNALTEAGDWQVESIHPFDFFPRTAHLETLVKMVRS